MPDAPRFPFGQPVLPRPPSAASPRPVFILGAYPSALHVAWKPLGAGRPIRAVAVENEPEPFWDGENEEAHIAAWKQAVRFDARPLGRIAPAGPLNGVNGRWLSENVLAPLGITRADVWLTDVLDTYRCGAELADRLDITYVAFVADSSDMHLAVHSLQAQPADEAIVDEALTNHRERLTRELRTARPRLIITLGNAALRVLRELVAVDSTAHAPERLDPSDYGRSVPVTTDGSSGEWIALAHPASPRSIFDGPHGAWIEKAKARRPS